MYQFLFCLSSLRLLMSGNFGSAEKAPKSNKTKKTNPPESALLLLRGHIFPISLRQRAQRSVAQTGVISLCDKSPDLAEVLSIIIYFLVTEGSLTSGLHGPRQWRAGDKSTKSYSWCFLLAARTKTLLKVDHCLLDIYEADELHLHKFYIHQSNLGEVNFAAGQEGRRAPKKKDKYLALSGEVVGGS